MSRTEGLGRCVGTCLLLIAGGGLLFLSGCSGKGAPTPGPNTKGGKRGPGGGAVPVTVAVASHRDVPVEVQAIGNVEAYASIGVRAQVGGQLNRVYFREGDFVKKGEPLFTIDPRPYEAALNEAVANVARSEAIQAQAQATLARDSAQARYAAAQATRYGQLFKEGITSKDQAEQFSANADAVTQAVAADQAAIESARASVVAGRAAVDTTKLQLAYTNIQSPIDGRTGSLNVKPGNIVAANTMDLITVNQVEPIFVTFAVPEANLSAIKQYLASQKMTVRARPQDDSGPEETGTLAFVDNTVDQTTGTIRLKGLFPNTNRRLWPGEFVRVTLRLTTEPNSVVVPNQAIQTGQSGSFVYVVKADRSVESRPVVPGARVDQDMVVRQGLEAGETVVTEGQLRLVPGSRVAVRDDRGGPGGPGGRGGPGGFGGRKGRPQS
jgi:membrane fusion protein, multidrug efflux system